MRSIIVSTKVEKMSLQLVFLMEILPDVWNSYTQILNIPVYDCALSEWQYIDRPGRRTGQPYVGRGCHYVRGTKAFQAPLQELERWWAKKSRPDP